MNVGFIGTGSMGGTLIEAFLRSGALQPQQIIASNRSQGKLQRFVSKYPGFRHSQSNADTAFASDILFLCVKPLEFKPVIDDIRAVLRPEQIVVSITSPVQIEQLESALQSKIAKIIPSVTNLVCSGAVLCIYGERLTPEDRNTMDRLLGYIGQPLHIRENFTRIASDLTSCGPAFLDFFLVRFIQAAVDVAGVSPEEAARVVSEMALGTGKLLTEGGLKPGDIQQRVAVPGGITSEGLRLLDTELSEVFHHLIQTTHAKYEEDKQKVEAMFRILQDEQRGIASNRRTDES